MYTIMGGLALFDKVAEKDAMRRGIAITYDARYFPLKVAEFIGKY